MRYELRVPKWMGGILIMGCLIWYIPRTGTALDSRIPEQDSDMSTTATITRIPDGDPYPLSHCASCDTDLSILGRPIHLTYEGRDLAFCCPHCRAGFEKNPTETVAALDEEMLQIQKPWYPIETCIVCGEALDSKGEPIDFLFSNRLVRVCGEACQTKLEADPDVFLARLDAAVFAAQRESYPLDICVVSDNTLPGPPREVDVVIANRLLRLCGADCLDLLVLNPARYLKLLDEAASMKDSGAATKQN